MAIFIRELRFRLQKNYQLDGAEACVERTARGNILFPSTDFG